MEFIEITSFSEKKNKNNYENVECEYYSDPENESYIKEFNDEELFLLHYTDIIIDLFYELKERFALNPDFLSKLKTTIFIDFIINTVLYDNILYSQQITNEKDITKDILYFENIFCNELHISYDIINSFITTFKIKLSYEKWKVFCYKNTYIPLNYIY